MMIFLSKIFQYLVRLPALGYWLIRDLIWYFQVQYWNIFDQWGLHIYVAKFGGGKTSSMVQRAYSLACQYKQLTIITNLTIKNFPKHTKILPLDSVEDILNAPVNSLVLIDEIGTLFNSRDFKRGDSLPKILFQYLCQCRHRHMMIFGTVQRWQFLDKQLRDITTSVRVCRTHLNHPFSRITTVTSYDAYDYELSYANPMVKISPVGVRVRIQSNKVRHLYDTMEMVNTLLEMKYDSDEQILSNQGAFTGYDFQPVEKRDQRKMKRNISKIN